MQLSIIILNYKMRGLVKNCLKAIFESVVNFPFEVIVVDNDSRDEVDQLIQTRFPQVRFIQTGANLGMGGGNNVGIRAAQGKYVLILNPDIIVFPDSLQKLYDFIQSRPDAGLVSPRLLNPDKTLQHTCYRWHRLITPLCRRTFVGKTSYGRKELERFLYLDWDHATTREVDWIQGSFFLLPKAVLDKIGLFDDRYFMYFEETDWCKRAVENGWQVYYLPETCVRHFSSGSRSRITAFAFVQSGCRYFEKHGTRRDVLIFKAALAPKAILNLIWGGIEWIVKPGSRKKIEDTLGLQNDFLRLALIGFKKPAL